MKGRLQRAAVFLAIFALLALAWLIFSLQRFPVAVIRAVDASGKPVAGAIIRPDGLRTKPGPYVSGHYGWATAPSWPPNRPVVTDADGWARVPYPKYVFERIETGQISFSIQHPDFVPDRPFRVVDTKPPAGAPWRVWLNYVGGRLRLKALVARTDPVVLLRGGVLRITARPGSSAPDSPPVFAQISGEAAINPDSWQRPQPGVLLTRQLEPGPRLVRAVQFDSHDLAWFSEAFTVNGAAGATNDLTVDLRPGVMVHGRLDESVPRPITHGRAIAQVSPPDAKSQDSPPVWHTWAKIRSNGTFDIGALPAGDLEIVAICDGYVSTNGPGQFKSSMRYPQKRVLGSNDLELIIGMEATGGLEVTLRDEAGKPVPNAVVATSPNVRYGEWWANILGSDCYHTADHLRPDPKQTGWSDPFPGFSGTTDVSGIVVLFNLPLEVKRFGVSHPQYALPAIGTASGGKSRDASVTLTAGETNHVEARLERIDQSPIKHY